MEEARFLLPMQRCVGGIQIQNDRLWRFSMRFQKELDQQFVDRFRSVGDLVVAFGSGRTGGGQFQPVQRTFAGQGFREIALPSQYPQERILP